jgi:hypothetical protein
MISTELRACEQRGDLTAWRAENAAPQEAHFRHLTERSSLDPVERLAASGRFIGSYVQDVSYASAGFALLRSESAGRHALVARNMQNSRHGARPGAIRLPYMWRIR